MVLNPKQPLKHIVSYFANTCSNCLFVLCLLIGIGTPFATLGQKKVQLDVKTGLTFARFQGPSEIVRINRETETYDFHTGFHLGLGINYPLSQNTALQLELLYVQKGTSYRFRGTSYWFFPTMAGEDIYSFGTRNMSLDIVNTYVELPISYVVHINRLELSAGAGLGYMVSAKGKGMITFSGLTERGAPVSPFNIELDFDYLEDPLQRVAIFDGPSRLIDGKVVKLPRSVNAYYESTGADVRRFRELDVFLNGNIAFFLSQSLFISLRMTYGLIDITNNRQEMALSRVNADKSLILTNDFDQNIAFFASIGLRF